MEVVVTTGLLELKVVQSSNQIITTNKPTSCSLQAGCPSCQPTNSVKALKEKYPIPWTWLPQAYLRVFQLCLWPLIAPGYLGVGLPYLVSALWCQYPITVDIEIRFSTYGIYEFFQCFDTVGWVIRSPSISQCPWFWIFIYRNRHIKILWLIDWLMGDRKGIRPDGSSLEELWGTRPNLE